MKTKKIRRRNDLKKKMNAFVCKLTGIVPALALLLAVSSADSACFFLAHQPDLPNGIEKYRK